MVAVAEGEQSTSNIEALSDGSFLVTCLGGSVGVVPLQGGKGIFIRGGQSVSISPQGNLSPMSPQAVPPAAPVSTETLPAALQKHGHARWILIGVGVAGAGVAAAVLSARAGTSSAVSPVSLTPPTSASSNSGASSSNPPAPDPPPPSQPSPQPPPPSPPQPPPPSPPQPSPPGKDCHHHHDKNCSQHIVIGLSFHF